MDGSPFAWRTELWHPLLVHFPIGLLITGSLVGLAFISLRKTRLASPLRFTLTLLLWSGIASFWIAFHFGNLAYSVVVRQICNPFILKDHLLWAYIAGVTFSLAAVADAARQLWPIFNRHRHAADVTIVLLMVMGAASLAYDGHLGASLVYEQAAGVDVPSSDCAEFN